MHLIRPPGCLYGRQTKSFSVNGIGVCEGVYAGFKSPTHAHEQTMLCLILQGIYTESSESKNFIRKPNNVFFHPAGVLHASDFRIKNDEKDVRLMRIEIDPRRFSHIREYSTFLERPTTYQSGLIPWLMMRLHYNFQIADDAAPLAIEGLTLEVIAEASRLQGRAHQNKVPVWLERAKELLNDCFAENLKLSEIAVAVGIHPVYLASEFRRHYKTTIGEYVRGLRIENACHALVSTNAPLAEIALAAGFSSQSHFTSVFKRMTGMTPAKYRANTL